MQRGVENLSFNMYAQECCIKLPLQSLSSKTLQILWLKNSKMWDFNFPCLKTLHLNRVYFESSKFFCQVSI